VLRHTDPRSAVFATEGAHLRLAAAEVVGAAQAVGDDAQARLAADLRARERALLM